MTSNASAMITKASKITKGLESWKAGCTHHNTLQITLNTPTKPMIWFLIVTAEKSSRSVKKAQ